ncbi:MAG: glycosyltransferase family 2 protein [Janthinobacterium lividum]
MLISVAMATYNGQRYLQEQLDSIAAQTVLPAELVVSDDGSTDNTLALIKAFAATAPFPVRIVEKAARLGFADNFLHATTACKHDFVAFCDQDDVWLPTKLETGRDRIEADGSLLAMHCLTTTNDALEPIGVWTQGIEDDSVSRPLELDPYINGWGNTMMFRRDLVTLIAREVRPRQPEASERPLSHDTWIYVLAAALGRVSHIVTPLILYRQHENNAIGIGKTGFWRKNKTKWFLSTRNLRERLVFYDRLSELFEELSRVPASPFAEPARTASIRYRERRRPLAARLDVYYGRSVSDRMRAYRALGDDADRRIKSRIKDLILGVVGLQAFLE